MQVLINKKFHSQIKYKIVVQKVLMINQLKIIKTLHVKNPPPLHPQVQVAAVKRKNVNLINQSNQINRQIKTQQNQNKQQKGQSLHRAAHHQEQVLQKIRKKRRNQPKNAGL